MTLKELIERQKRALAAKLAERQAHTDAINAIRGALGTDERDLNADEAAAVTTAVEARTRIDAEIEPVKAQLAELERELAADEAATRLASETTPTGERGAGAPGEHRGGAQTSEARTYTAETSRRGVSFFVDAFRAKYLDDFEASTRLARHRNEVRVEQEQRAGTTTTFGSLVVPQYLPDLVALPIRNGRPLANLIPSLQLPDQGMTITIPRVTSGAAVATQATQNTAVQNTDVAVTDLTIPVVTVAGQQDISRQMLERGTPGTDQIIYSDLAAAYSSELDRQVIAGTGTGGTALGMLNTAGILAATAFGATVTIANFYTKLAGLIAAITGQGAGIVPDLIVMHPRRWGWLTAQTDSTGRPLALATVNGPYNATALNLAPGKVGSDLDPVDGATIVGSIHGIPITTDPNIPSNVGTNNEDVVLVLDTTKQLLWEDGKTPKQLRFEETLAPNLTVKLVVYGYFAFSAGRYPTSIGKAGGLDATGGQGFVAPTF